jgi:hypothetical protein
MEPDRALGAARTSGDGLGGGALGCKLPGSAAVDPSVAVSGLSRDLFPLDPGIRNIAVNAGGAIVEMKQRDGSPSHNPPETDRMEELIVNPIVLEAARRRGDLDLGGLR